MSTKARPQTAEPALGPTPVAGAALCVLEQCALFVEALADAVYMADSSVIRGGTAGKHIRHTLDHFAAALAGAAGEVIDYDHRDRDVPMETDRRAALAGIRAIRADLARLTEEDLSRAVRVRVMLGGDGLEAELESTLGRELAFAAHHAIHHHAMMKAIAQEFGATLPPDFGKAPSTLHHERTLRH